MHAWYDPVSIIVAGTAGGLVNAFTTQNGFILPTTEVDVDGAAKVWRPGVVGNVAVGAVAALVSWGLYGAGATLKVFAENQILPDLTYSALVGAILVGTGGARWLTSEVDKKLLRGTAVAAAEKDADRQLAAHLATSAPFEAFSAAVRR